MLIRKIVLQPINLANAPKRSTDKIEQAKRGCDAQQCEGHQGYVNCAAGAEGQRDGEGRGGTRRSHCMPHAVGNFIMRLSVSSDQESASGQAGVAATAAAPTGGGGSPRVAFTAGPLRRLALNQSSATNAKNTNNFN